MFSDSRAGAQARQALAKATSSRHATDDTTTRPTTTTFSTPPHHRQQRSPHPPHHHTTTTPERSEPPSPDVDTSATPAAAGAPPRRRATAAPDRRSYADAAATGAASASTTAQPQRQHRPLSPSAAAAGHRHPRHRQAQTAPRPDARVDPSDVTQSHHHGRTSTSPSRRTPTGTAQPKARTSRGGGAYAAAGAAATAAPTTGSSPAARPATARTTRSGGLLTPEQIERVVASASRAAAAASLPRTHTTPQRARSRDATAAGAAAADATRTQRQRQRSTSPDRQPAAAAAATAATAATPQTQRRSRAPPVATAAGAAAASAAAAAPSRRTTSGMASKFRLPTGAPGAPRPAAWRARGAAPVRAAGAAAAAAAEQRGGAARPDDAASSSAPSVGDSSDSSDDDDDTSATSTDDTDSCVVQSDAEEGFVSGACAGCGKAVAHDDSGVLCDMPGCRGLKCDACTPDRRAWWWCEAHAAPKPGTTPTFIQLPAVLSAASKTSVENALETLGDWKADADLRALAADLEDTISYGSNCKGTGAIRRLAEFVRGLPPKLRDGEVTQGTIDFTLASFVGARCRTARRSRGSRPREWKGSRPAPTSVGGETNALIGLARVAGILPGTPQGSIPRTRRALRVHGCMRKLDASPRAYTFHWELAAARKHCTSPQAVAVWSLCVISLYFLLRPRYAREAGALNLRREAGDRYAFHLDTGDKTNQPRRMPCTSSSSDDDDEARPRARARARAPRKTETELPAAHPRYTVASGRMLHEAMTTWTEIRGKVEGSQPWFCRIEPARQTTRAPKHARATTCNGSPCWIWPDTKLTPEVIKRNMVAFLTPIVGAARAQLRVLSGLRGGGETEHALRNVQPHVRATIGWWKIRRLKEVGAMVGYEGCSVEEMVDATRGLGSKYIRYITPGVYTTTRPLSRSTNIRRMFPRSRVTE